MEPKRYPAKNTEELDAVHALLGLLDIERIKPDIKALDKVPNHDGSVELVDAQQRPIGKLQVQVKKIPDGATQFDCPIELVAYSTRISSPFVLICVDVGNRKAYWRHISPVMPGLKPEQKTFVLKFQAVVEEIGDGFPYYDRWMQLCADYLGRVSRFPQLEHQLSNEIGLSKLPVQERCLFQEFIQEVNLLLDVDIPIVKHAFFVNAWKLGACVHQADAEVLYFTLYTVRSGENAPLIIHVPRIGERPRIGRVGDVEMSSVVSVEVQGGTGSNVASRWTTKGEFGTPKQAADRFVFRYLSRMLRDKSLKVHGRNQSIELLMWFTREYAHTLGLPVSANYKTCDLSYGLNVFLPMWYSLSYPRIIRFYKEHYGEMLRQNPYPSFEQIANTAQRHVQASEFEVREAIARRLRQAPYPVRTYEVSLEALQEAVDYLLANDVEEISRLDRPWSKDGHSVWQCYTREELKHNFTIMLNGAAEDYREFIEGNRFGRLAPPLLSREIAFIYAADTSKWVDAKWEPGGSFYQVENADRSLPMVTFVDLADEPDACILEGDDVVLRGVRRKWRSYGGRLWDHFNEKLRIRATLYDWLKEDLERRYGAFPA